MNTCPYCNKDFEGKPYFCNYCGKPLFIGNAQKAKAESEGILNQNDVSGNSPISNPSFIPEKSCKDAKNKDHDTILDNKKSDNCELLNKSVNRTNSEIPNTTIDAKVQTFNNDTLNDNIYVENNPTPQKTIKNNETSRYLSSSKMMISTDTEEYSQDEEPKSSHWLTKSLALIFVVLIIAGLVAFFIYDKKFNDQKSIDNNRIEDSIRNSLLEKESKLKRVNDLNDSIRLHELQQVHVEDSLEKIRKHEEWVSDSLIIDKRMTELISEISPTNKILAKYMDYNSCYCYYTDTLNPILKLTCFDGKKNEVSNILIDNIQCKLISHFITPDSKSLVMLCRDDTHDYGLAYKINLSNNTVEDYKSMDDNGNKCFDIGRSNSGFYMKFGKGDSIAFKNLYTIYYDKYGNYINKE